MLVMVEVKCFLVEILFLCVFMWVFVFYFGWI